VLVEKPAAKTSEEARKLAELAKKTGKLFFVGHTYLYNPAIHRIKTIIDSGQLGNIYAFDSIRFNTMLIRPDVNVIWDLAPHDFSILLYLFSEKPYKLLAIGSGRDPNKCEVAHIILSYKSGLSAHIHLNWLSPVKLRKTMISASNKMILFDDLDQSEKVRIYDYSSQISREQETPFLPKWRSGQVIIPHIKLIEPLYQELKQCISDLKTGRKPVSDGVFGLRVVNLLEACDRSLVEKKEIEL
jgi:predicted dehydrogenase